MLAFTSDTNKRTIDEYLNEQAILLTYSATEYAMLAISGKDRTAGCITSISSTYPSSGSPIFQITTNIQYIWSDDAALPDRSSSIHSSCRGYIDNLVTPESHGAALIDVVVTTDSSLGLNEPIRFHRRTLQKL
jgi:hypothetical protein